MLCTAPMDRVEAMEINAKRLLAAAVRSLMAANGAKGGRASAAKLTAEQRRDRARKAAAARHAKRRRQ